MQISPANLLLAAQQPAAQHPAAHGQSASFAQAMVGGGTAQAPKPASFAPPDFASETKEPEAPQQAAQPAPLRPQTGYSAAAAPGSQLDIRV